MTNPIEALDAIEQALRALPHQGDCCIRFKPACDCPKEGIKPTLATLRQQVADLVAFRESHQWRPIETAPRDGSRVLVCNSNRNLYAPESAFYGHYHPNAKGTPQWRSVSTSTKIAPTHFQPLPTPPASDGGQVNG